MESPSLPIPGTGCQVSGTGSWHRHLVPDPARRRGPATEHRGPARPHRVCIF